MRRTLIAGAIVMTGALLLTGCGRSSTAPQSSSAVTKTKVSAGPATGDLQVWAEGNEGELLPKLLKGFEQQNPGVHVTVTSIPWQGAHDKLANAIVAGQTPDVAMVGTTWLTEFAATGGMSTVPSGLVKSSDFFPGSWQTVMHNGAAYGVPWYADTRILYYRKDLAQAAGLAAPKTWADLNTFSAALQKNGAKWGTYVQSGGQGTANMFLPFVWQSGGHVMNAARTKFTFDTPEFKKAVDYYGSLFKNGYSSSALLTGQYQSMFVNGSLASYIGGPFELPQLKALIGANADKEIGVALLPYSKTPASFMGGGDFAVFKTAKNPDAGWKLIRYLAQPAVQQQWYAISGDLPAAPAAWTSGTLAQDTYLKTIGTQLKSGHSLPAITTWAQIDAVINTELEKVFRGTETSDAAIASIQRQAEQIGTGK